MEESFLIRGKVVKYGHNIDTDVIFPGKYLGLTDEKIIAQHAMEGLDADFYNKVRRGYNIIVAGSNFGCGSSREQAPLSLKLAGVKLVIAESFARIFFRNSININLPVLICKGVTDKISDGDEVKANLATGEIKNLTRKTSIRAEPYPPHILDMLKVGGLIKYVKKRLE